MSYGKYIYAVCDDAGTFYGHALAQAVGYKGAGPAFGGARGVGVRVKGSGSVSPTHWLLYTVANNDRQEYVDEFNSDGPFTKLNGIGASDSFIAVCKAHMIVEITNLPADIDAYAVLFLDRHNLELMPQ